MNTGGIPCLSAHSILMECSFLGRECARGFSFVSFAMNVEIAVEVRSSSLILRASTTIVSRV